LDGAALARLAAVEPRSRPRVGPARFLAFVAIVASGVASGRSLSGPTAEENTMTLKFSAIAAAAFASAAFASAAFGTDRLVPQQYPTIQAAVNASVNGDRVLISPGTYTGNVTITNKSITLKGADWISGSPQSHVTAAGTVISCVGNGTQSVVLQDLFIRDAAKGVLADNVDVVMSRCYLFNFNNPGGNGGCYEQRFRSLTAHGCYFREGRSGWGGGLYIGFGSAALYDCALDKNQATLQGSGGFVQSGSSLRLERCTLATQSVDIVTNSTGYLADSRLCESSMLPVGFGASVVDLGGNTMLASCSDCDAQFGADIVAIALGLNDCDQDLVPDHCDQSCQAVHWSIAEGGNDHWYARIPRQGRTWSQCRAAAIGMGGDLASIASAAEEAAIAALVPSPVAGGYWNAAFVGASQPIGSPAGASWSWSDGTRWAGVTWQPGQPDGGEGYLGVYRLADGSDLVRFGDWPASDGGVYYFLVEWTADCNGDGRVDYGQIQSGQLDDLNGNHVPDCCEQGGPCRPCLADISGNGIVDGVDLAFVLGSWGVGGGKAGADINGDGVVAGEDLAMVLGAWGACPN
jgi:hypothetical protein